MCLMVSDTLLARAFILFHDTHSRQQQSRELIATPPSKLVARSRRNHEKHERKKREEITHIKRFRFTSFLSSAVRH